MTWIDSGSVPVVLQTGTDNLGSGVLLPDGRVLQIGEQQHRNLHTVVDRRRHGKLDRRTGPPEWTDWRAKLRWIGERGK